MAVTKVYAKFTGTNKTHGYQRGKKYHLNFAIIDKGSVEVSPEGNVPSSKESPCVYPSLHSFLANWQVLG